MDPKAILEHHQREPFCPLRIYLCNGATYEVTRRELMLVGRTRMIIGLNPDADGIPRETLYLVPGDVTRLELLGAHSANKAPRRRIREGVRSRSRRVNKD